VKIRTLSRAARSIFLPTCQGLLEVSLDASKIAHCFYVHEDNFSYVSSNPWQVGKKTLWAALDNVLIFTRNPYNTSLCMSVVEQFASWNKSDVSVKGKHACSNASLVGLNTTEQYVRSTDDYSPD